MSFDTNVPIPPKVQLRDKYELKDWPLNASKFFAGEGAKFRAAIVSCAKSSNRGATFTSRTVEENGIKGMRLWRLE